MFITRKSTSLEEGVVRNWNRGGDRVYKPPFSALSYISSVHLPVQAAESKNSASFTT